MELVKYRDAGMANCTYFWINDQRHHVSPFFDSQHDAEIWFKRSPRPKNEPVSIPRRSSPMTREALKESQKRAPKPPSTD